MFPGSGVTEKMTDILGKAKRLAPLLVILLALGVVIALAAVLPPKRDEGKTQEPPVVNVTVMGVESQSTIEDEFVLHAVVEPYRTVMVAAEVSGQVERIGRRETDLSSQGKTYLKGQEVAEGEPVAEGDCLVELNTDLLQAEYDRVKAQSEYDAREFGRMQELFERKIAAKQELDAAKTAMMVSQAMLVEISQRLRRAKIRAPMAGILNDLPEEVGQYVQPGAYVAEIVDIDSANVIVDVPERDVYYLSVGDPATVIVDPLGDREVVGRIAFISELADEKSRTTRVEIVVDNEDRSLRSGQIVRAKLNRRTLTDVVMIPLASVIPLEDGKVVYIVEGGNATRRRIELDMDFIKGTEVRVLSGLSGGETLIVTGHRYVGDGQKVVVREQQFSDDSPVSIGS